MNKKTISIILLAIFLVTIMFTVANVFLDDANTEANQTGTLTIANRPVNYEKAGKCLEVIDGNTIQVYGVGRVQLTQVDIAKQEPGFSQAKNFVKDKYDRTLAIVYTNDTNINRELLNNNLAKVSYFEPSEFEKGLD